MHGRVVPGFLRRWIEGMDIGDEEIAQNGRNYHIVRQLTGTAKVALMNRSTCGEIAAPPVSDI